MRSVGSHLEIERDDVDALREQQRMPALLHDRTPRAGTPKRRRDAVELEREYARARSSESSSTSASSDVAECRRAVRTHGSVSSREDALDLLALVGLELADAVAELDGRRRLDEQRGAGRRRVVHDAADAPRALRGAPESRSARCAS